MSDSGQARSRNEAPVFFDADGRTLFGIVTTPTIEPLGTIAILLPAGGFISTDRNRLAVRLSRHLAGLGFHALRFDYHGLGESEGLTPRFRLDEPFTSDLLGAVEWARRFGLRRVVLIGSCFGARTALACASEIEELDGVALIAAPARDYEMGERIATELASGTVPDRLRRVLRPGVIRGLLDPRKRRVYARVAKAALRSMRARNGHDGHDETGASPLFASELLRLAHRPVPLLLLFGSDDDLWSDFNRARQGRVGEALSAGPDTIELITLPGEVHGLKSVGIQDSIVDAVSDWLARVASRVPSASG
jgi:pimeloyl-ACP methyl ester carboxylesterase